LDFFGRQAEARGRSRWLLAGFAIATVAVALAVAFVLAMVAGGMMAPEGARTVAGPDPAAFTIAAICTAAFIGLAALWRHLQLSQGGGKVAQALGGDRVTGLERDPLRRRLHNVVEEMAIAAGVPVPEVYVLENEPGINAFAAGLEPADAAVAVTRGGLERLSRDELQGVIAHEFSHILNGDMRLNARLMGYVFGLVAVSTIGRMMMRGAGHFRLGGGRNSRAAGGVAVLAVAGVAILLLGSIGVLAGRILQAALARQRESLADASAVQFTRQTSGLANALKRIAASPLSSYVRSARREEIGHMLFAGGRPLLTGLLATHPPLAERIRALDPRWKPGDAPPPLPAEPERRPEPQPAGPALPGFLEPAIAMGLIGSVDLDVAARVLSMVPKSLHQMILEPEGAAATVLALLLDPRENLRNSQLSVLEVRLGGPMADRVAKVAGHLADVAPTLRLALLDLATPALRRLPIVRREDLLHLVQRLVELDGVVSSHEAALAAALESRIAPRGDGAARADGALALLAICARAGHPEDEAAARAWIDGVAKLDAGGFPLPSPLPRFEQVEPRAGATAAATASKLAVMRDDYRRLLMEALAEVASHDGRIARRELEVLRAAAAAMGCPMPPLAAEDEPST
jgi:Zn-dependent protease with chaperone function